MIANGNAIKRLRSKRHMSQRAFASEVGVSQNTISEWECGRSIARDNAELLAKILGCRVYDIAEEPLGGGPRIRYTNVKGETIRRLRKAQGMTQEVLAELANTHQSLISAWENGLRNMQTSDARNIAAALGCKLGDIIKLEAIS